jgi:hypothetical protein
MRKIFQYLHENRSFKMRFDFEEEVRGRRESSQTHGLARLPVSGCDGLRLFLKATGVANSLAHFEMPP